MISNADWNRKMLNGRHARLTMPQGMRDMHVPRRLEFPAVQARGSVAPSWWKNRTNTVIVKPRAFFPGGLQPYTKGPATAIKVNF